MKRLNKRNLKIYSGILNIICCFILTVNVFPQGEIQKEVKVIKPYSPTLSDASKINLLPLLNDTIKINPEFEYKIYPKKYETQFRINPIKPARMVGLPLTKLYKSQLTLGIGNYNTPIAELTVNELRSKTTAMGLYLNHHSSNGRVKLENGQKANSDFSDNEVRLYAKKMFYRSVLEAALSGEYNSVLFYGYEPSIDTLLQEANIKQKIHSAGAHIRYYSSNPDSFHFNYDAGLNYNIVSDKFKNTEHGFDLQTMFNSQMKDAMLGADIRFRYFSFSGEIDTSSNLIIDINPYYCKKTAEWRFLIGLNTSFDRFDQGVLGLYPRAEFEFNIVKDVLIPYLGLTGWREVNNYKKILVENPYLTPGIRLRNTDYSLVGFAGLKGRFSSKITYNVKASYFRADSMYFFINDTSTILRNKFIPVYDNASLTTIKGEITWHQSDNLQFLFMANYNTYKLETIEKPWHRPLFELSLEAGYNVKEKILVNVNLFYTGKRYAPGVLSNPIELKGFLDGNLSIEYRYTKILSFFVKLNNFTASKYQIWNQYPAQRFQFIGGFSYAL